MKLPLSLLLFLASVIDRTLAPRPDSVSYRDALLLDLYWAETIRKTK